VWPDTAPSTTRGSSGSPRSSPCSWPHSPGAEHEQRVAAFAGGVFGPEATLASELSAEIVYSASYTIMGLSTVLRNILAEWVLGLPKDPSAR
jgi:hypothetical protein